MPRTPAPLFRYHAPFRYPRGLFRYRSVVPLPVCRVPLCAVAGIGPLSHCSVAVEGCSVTCVPCSVVLRCWHRSVGIRCCRGLFRYLCAVFRCSGSSWSCAAVLLLRSCSCARVLVLSPLVGSSGRQNTRAEERTRHTIWQTTNRDTRQRTRTSTTLSLLRAEAEQTQAHRMALEAGWSSSKTHQRHHHRRPPPLPLLPNRLLLLLQVQRWLFYPPPPPTISPIPSPPPLSNSTRHRPMPTTRSHSLPPCPV